MALRDLTEYERRRLENIKRNDEMMAALRLHSRAQLLSAASKRQRVQGKGYKTSPEKKSKSETPTVIRRSLRARGIPPDYSDSRSRGDIPESIIKTPKPPSAGKPSARILGPLGMRDAYRGDASDQALVETIMGVSKKTQTGVSIEGESGANLINKAMGSLDLQSLTLEQENVARLLPGRILAVRFFPTFNMKMIVAGNKFGNISFWDVKSDGKDGDGIYLYHPHSAPVSGISVQPHALSKVFTSSYDGLIRLMDAEREVFNLVYASDNAIFSLSQQPHDVRCIYFSEGHGRLNSWDERAGKLSNSWILHEDRINCIDFKTDNPNLMATSSTDGTACIWDLRSMNADKPQYLRTVTHKRAVHSAYFSPSGSILATTSIDNKIGVLRGPNFEDLSMIHHDNQTGRWISSFRAIWGWDDSYLFVGNMIRAVDVVSPARGNTIMTLHSPLMSAIPCRFDAYPCQVGTLAGATSGGQVYVWTSH